MRHLGHAGRESLGPGSTGQGWWSSQLTVRAWPESVTDALPTQAITEAVLQKPTGEELSLKVTARPFGQSPMKFSLLALGAVFALLGAAVVLRRPDLQAARVFGIFAGFASLALAVAPDSDGPGHPWALIVQFMTHAGFGASLLSFVVVLTRESFWSRRNILRPVPRVRGIRLHPGCGLHGVRVCQTHLVRLDKASAVLSTCPYPSLA